MPDENYIEEVAAALTAVEYARQVRSLHRRRTEKGSKQREADLRLALDRIREAMRPLRRHIGRFPYEPGGSQAQKREGAIREASHTLQRERRKLHKMKATPRRKHQ